LHSRLKQLFALPSERRPAGAMGGLIGLPLRMAGSCLGTCAAFSFFRLADSGTVKTMTAVRCVLAWLQVFGTSLAWTVSSASQGWIQTTCDRLELVGYGDLGVCSCRGSGQESICFSDQMAVRAVAATMVVFLLLLVFALSGCALGAARYHETGKFLGLLVLWAASLAAPNQLFSSFASVAMVVSCAFVLVQSCIILDSACSWHDWWYEHARGEHKGMHEVAIIATSAAFIVGGMTLAVLLWCATSTGAAHCIVLGAAVLSMALLVVSITDWCEHGTLLTSSVMLLYNMWLVQEAMANMCLATAGGPAPKLLPSWFGLVLCAVTVLLLARGVGFDVESREQLAPRQALLPTEPGDVAAVRAAMSDDDVRSFILHCALHAVVPLYVVSALPRQAAASQSGAKDCGTFAVHIFAAFASQLLYGWHLVAPKVLKNRQF